MWLPGYDAWKTREPAEDCGPVCQDCGDWLEKEWGRSLWYCERCDVNEPRLTRCVVQRDEVGGSYDPDCAWLATPNGYDLDVPSGHGATPLLAVAALLWDMDLDDEVRPEEVEIVWE